MLKLKTVSSLLLAVFASACMASSKGTVAVWPWTFDKGTDTARNTAVETVREIAEKSGYQTVSKQRAFAVAKNLSPTIAYRNGNPIKSDLRRYAKAVGANLVVYGTVKWHTRSIWVGSGPKTISTATANVYAYDARQNRIVYSKRGIVGRSDEKENTLKVVGSVILTPMVTAVSGGPATPREQRAVQIALGRAYQNWVRAGG